MDELTEIQPNLYVRISLRVLSVFIRIWARLTSASTLRLLAPLFAAALLYLLWRLWRYAEATPMGRAVRWWVASTLIAATCALAVYLMIVPPESSIEANEARAMAEERFGQVVYTEPLAVLGGLAVFVSTLAAAGTLRRSRVPGAERREVALIWDARTRPMARALAFTASGLSVAAVLAAFGAVVGGTAAAAEIPAPALGGSGRGSLWVGTTNGLSRLLADGDGARWEQYRRPWTPLPSNQITAVAPGPNGEVWVSTTFGLARGEFGPSRRVTWFDASAAKGDLPGVVTLDVAVDRSGVAWAATDGGASAVDRNGQARLFTFKTTPLLHQLLDAAYVDRDGRVWMGGAGGVNVYRPPTFNALQESGEWIAGFNRPSTNGALPDNLVFTVTGDSQGRIWFGTAGGAAAFRPVDGAYALASGEAAQWETLTPANSQLPSAKVHAITQDRADRLYFGTEEGLAILDESAPPERRWRVLRGPADSASATGATGPGSTDQPRLPHAWVEALAVGPDGRVWIGTKNGLAVFDPNQGAQPLPVYRSNSIRRWTSLFWMPHSKLDVLADEITALAWAS